MQPPPHIPPATSTAAASAALESQPDKKRRGSYSCGRCGEPKKGHDCLLPLETDIVQPGRFHAVCLWEVLKRLPPSSLLMAGRVCSGWRKSSKKMWKATEELRIRVPESAPIDYIESLLQKCPRITSLYLNTESDFNATALKCIELSCPNLEVFEISTSGAAVNRISGGELNRFVTRKSRLRSLTMGGCSNMRSVSLSSSSLSLLWLTGLYSLSQTIFDCPNLRGLLLEFSPQKDDSTDLVAVVNSLRKACTKLKYIHIASAKLSDTVVLALTAVKFRELRKLSLILGTSITDASVSAISSSYTNLELLALNDSSITDKSLVMICDVFPKTLSYLMVAFCPYITASGIQFIASQLPFLEELNCDTTVSDPSSDNLDTEEKNPQKTSGCSEKIFIKHELLKNFSLCGCSCLRTLSLDCPELKALNLKSCSNLQPESLTLKCPKLEVVSASGCQDQLTGAIKKQVIPTCLIKE